MRYIVFILTTNDPDYRSIQTVAYLIAIALMCTALAYGKINNVF